MHFKWIRALCFPQKPVIEIESGTLENPASYLHYSVGLFLKCTFTLCEAGVIQMNRKPFECRFNVVIKKWDDRGFWARFSTAQQILECNVCDAIMMLTMSSSFFRLSPSKKRLWSANRNKISWIENTKRWDCPFLFTLKDNMLKNTFMTQSYIIQSMLLTSPVQCAFITV